MSAYQDPVAEYGGWFARVVAYIIDGLVSSLLTAPAYIALLAGPKHIVSCNLDGYSYCRQPTGATIGLAIVLGLAGVIVFLVMYSKKVGNTGQSWGHKAMGLRVVDAQTGAVIGQGRAIGRYFAMIISAIPCYLGFLWPLWDVRKQTFHDKIVGTVVLKA